MLGSTAAAFVAKASHNPAGVQAIRAATEHLGHQVEFVLLEEDRAIVIASLARGTAQPRPLVPAEQTLVTGDANNATAVEPDSTSARVLVADRLTALTVRCRLSNDGERFLRETAAALAAAMRNAPLFEEGHAAADILAGLRDAVVILAPDLSISWSSNATLTLLGWTPQEVVGRLATDLIHPDDIGTAVEAMARLSEANLQYRVKLRLKDASGQWVPVSVTGLDHTTNPAIGGVLLSLRNDEVEVENEQALDRTRKVSSTILQNLNDAVIATDEVGAISIVNASARELFSIGEKAAVASLDIRDIALLDEAGHRVSGDAHPLRSRRDWSGEQLQVETTEGIRYVTVSRSDVGHEDDHLGVVVTFHDMTQAYRDALELRSRALHDQLTGLANRRFLSERLQSLAATGAMPRLAALFVDIDRFKNVNDIHGHRVGDAVLKATADRLRTYIRDADVLARPGGDEFLVILLDPATDQVAIDVAERIRSALSEPFEIEGTRLHLTASVGIALQDEGELDDERLLQYADIALYAAKDRGRDRVEIFDQQLATSVEQEQQQRNMVRSALDNDRLVMYLQPIVDGDGRTVGVEALARCIDTNGQLVEPGGFMDAIEGTNLIVRLDRLGFEKSCAVAAQLAAEPDTRHIWVAANFSAMTLAQSDFAEVAMEIITNAGVSPTSICIEVTETAAFEAGDATLQALVNLNNQGVRIALDDFGTGYSSLAHLRDLPLSTVKIDRSFTSALSSNGVERAIAAAVRDLARSLGFSVVAEGVETESDRAAALDIGVETMQGWLFAKALPPDEFMTALKDARSVEQPDPW